MAWISPALPLGRRSVHRAVTRMSSARPSSKPVSVGFLGCGSMGGAVLTRLIDSGTIPRDLAHASARTSDTLSHLAALQLPEQNLYSGAGCNAKLVKASDVIVLGVKPQMLPGVLAEINGSFDPSRHLLLSLVAGVSSANHMEALGHSDARVVRAIPSMSARIGKSATAMIAGSNASEEDVARALEMMQVCGTVELLPSEALLDVATACLLPTYTYLALEAIADAAVLEGLPRAIARRLAANSLCAAASLAVEEPENHPAVLRNSAESPGGVTIRATRELECGGYRASIMDAVSAATARSKELNE